MAIPANRPSSDSSRLCPSFSCPARSSHAVVIPPCSWMRLSIWVSIAELWVAVSRRVRPVVAAISRKKSAFPFESRSISSRRCWMLVSIPWSSSVDRRRAVIVSAAATTRSSTVIAARRRRRSASVSASCCSLFDARAIAGLAASSRVRNVSPSSGGLPSAEKRCRAAWNCPAADRVARTRPRWLTRSEHWRSRCSIAANSPTAS